MGSRIEAEVDRLKHDIAYKIYGYMVSRPNETELETFERARSDYIASLTRRVEVASGIELSYLAKRNMSRMGEYK
jgi:hypothetical protein